MSQFTIYGPADRNTSWGRVATGMADGLRALDRLAELVSLADLNDDDGLHKGYDAEVGIFVGAPNRAGILTRGQHRERWLMLAPNSTWLPRGDLRVLTVGDTRVLTGILTPSEWGKQIIEGYVERDGWNVPVRVWQHGIDPIFAEGDGPSARDPERFSLLHLSTTAISRKGTRLLIEAWRQAMLGPHPLPPATSKLTLICDGPERYEADVQQMDFPGTVDLCCRVDFAPEQLRVLYRAHDFIVQPSRGEGFGMVPLEARAAGVPVIATTCTGHGEHMAFDSPGVVAVASGEYRPIDDGPGAQAPHVTVRSILEALGQAYARTVDLQEASRAEAPKVVDHWSWPEVCVRFINRWGEE